MSRARDADLHIIKHPDLFSELILQFPLYPYQKEVVEAIGRSVLDNLGREYLLVFPRQSGKNEAIAHLLVWLLNLLQRKGGNIVYGAPGDGLGRGIVRLEERLDNHWNRGLWSKSPKPVRRSLGKATVVFLSTHPSASSRGETAHHLLVIDEMQDQSAAHIEAVFEPMRAAENATAVYMGTVRTSSDALWTKKRELEELERTDGHKRVHIIYPETVIAQNPRYGSFLEGKLAKHGRQHPIIASEYFLEPLDADGHLFDRRRRSLMTGSHPRLTAPAPHETYIATIDIAGQDVAATNAGAKLANPRRDYTTATIFRYRLVNPDDPGPHNQAVDIMTDQGSRHFQPTLFQPSLADQILAYLNHWSVSHVIVDASGVGQGLSDWIAHKWGSDRTTPVQFTSRAKSELGARFLSLIETGRFHYWHDPTPLSDPWWFFQQCRACTYTMPADGKFERDLRWFVPPAATVDTPTGRQPIHDDRLISAALVALADDLWRKGVLRSGQARSAIIPAPDPLASLTW